jgi:hypothetical protein
MDKDINFFVGVVVLWVIGAIISISITCGIIWFAIWTAKHFGMF